MSGGCQTLVSLARGWSSPRTRHRCRAHPAAARTLARGPALENGGGHALADSKPRWGGSGRSPRLSSSPLFLQSARRTCTARQQSRWCTCWVGDFDPSFTGREERSITSPPSTDPPVCAGGCLGRHGAVLGWDAEPRTSPRLGTKVPPLRGWQLALLAARPELWTSSLGTCKQLRCLCCFKGPWGQ